MSLAQLRNISKKYATQGGGELTVLDGVNLELNEGAFATIQGPSGCGKSTTLLVLGGLLRPDSGHVEVAGEDVYAMSADARALFRASAIGFIFQQFHLVPYLNVEQNVLAAAMNTSGSRAETRSRAEALLEKFGLQDRRRHAPGKLSTGERQRTALARALLNRPKILLADEPTGNLDPDNTEIVLNELRDFARNGGAVLLVTHDERVAEAASIRYIMESGQLQEMSRSST